MKKLPFAIVISLAIVGCSSSPFQKKRDRAEVILEHMSQTKMLSGGEFPAKFNESGTRGQYLLGVGKSIYPTGTNIQLCESAAVSAAKFNLIESAPSSFESIVEKSLGTGQGMFEEFSKRDLSVTRLEGLKGIEVEPRDVMCKTQIEPLESGSYKTSIICKAIARVKISELVKASEQTKQRSIAGKNK